MPIDVRDQDPASTSETTSPLSKAWAWIGYLFAWVVAMAVWQKGLTGYLAAFLLVYAIGGVALGAVFATRLAARHALPFASLAFLGLWWAVGGTYSWQRDLVVTLLIVPIVIVSFPESRTWVKRLPARLRARRRLRRWTELRDNTDVARASRAAQLEAFKNGVFNVGKRAWAAARAPSIPQARPLSPAPTRRRLSPAVVATAALAVWCTLSGLDYLFESKPLPRNGSVLRPPSMPAAYEHLRVGLALSGGGYRAALVHAGVVDALGQLGVPVTHMSSVSGGSIIASYLSLGGSPIEFRNAVADGRFRMTRDLMAFQNLIRLPSPALAPGIDVELWPFFDHFSRLNVQANLVDRVLLSGARPGAAGARKGPALMICMTDLTYGLSVGALDDGYLFVGPASMRYFKAPEAIELPSLDRLADRVAVSGAFPGAFPALQVRARITTTAEPISQSKRTSDLSLLLADGGVRDNLGLTLLEAADALARERPADAAASGWTGFTPPADWALDLILVSDGGKFMQAQADQGVLASMMRAIDLSGLETGVLHAMRKRSDHPLVVLSALSTVAPGPDAAIVGMQQSSLRDAQYQFFRPATLAPDVLEKLVALVPAKVAARQALDAYTRLPPGFSVRLDGLAERCKGGDNEANRAAECDWWRLVSLVGEDIWRTTQVFVQTPTLSDSFSADQANAVFRFGQYMALLKTPEIRKALEVAARNRAR
jgi:predicted acylesterase/phospholipase RssA